LCLPSLIALREQRVRFPHLQTPFASLLPGRFEVDESLSWPAPPSWDYRGLFCGESRFVAPPSSRPTEEDIFSGGEQNFFPPFSAGVSYMVCSLLPRREEEDLFLAISFLFRDTFSPLIRDTTSAPVNKPFFFRRPEPPPPPFC